MGDSDRVFCCSVNCELDVEIFVIILESPFIKNIIKCKPEVREKHITS